MKKIIVFVLILTYKIYDHFTKRAYFVSGTGILTETKDRKWFSSILYTSGNCLPIKSMERNIEKQFKFDTAIVTNFIRISLKQAKSFSEEIEFNHNDDGADKF